MRYLALLFLISYEASSTDLGTVTSLLRAREFSQALSQTRTLLKQSPNNPQLWTLQGLAHTGLNDENAALGDYRHALNIFPDYIPALKAEAQLEYQNGNKEGITTLRRILKLQPNDSVSHAMLGALAFQQHDCKTTVDSYSASKELLAAQPAALTQYGECLAQEKHQDEAIAAFRQAVALEPDAWQMRYDLSLEELRTNRTQLGLKDLLPLLTPQQHRPEVLNLASTLYETTGNTPDAVRILRQAIIDNSQNTELYLHFADLCFVHKSFQVGIDMLNAGLTQLPDSAQLYTARGVLFVQLGEYSRAEADFAKAEKLNPNQSFSSIAQGLTKLQENHLDAALASTRVELKRDPKNAFLHYLEAETLRQKGVTPPSNEFDEAVNAALAAVQLKPDYPIAEDLLGSFYLQEGRVDVARQQFENALRHDPLNESAIYHMITVSRKTGRTGDIPGLVKRLAEAKAAGRRRDDLAAQFILVEPKQP